jgi:hypothetical protein
VKGLPVRFARCNPRGGDDPRAGGSAAAAPTATAAASTAPPNAPSHSPSSALSTRRTAKPASSAATYPTTPLHAISLLTDIVFVEISQALGTLLGVVESDLFLKNVQVAHFI